MEFFRIKTGIEWQDRVIGQNTMSNSFFQYAPPVSRFHLKVLITYFMKKSASSVLICVAEAKRTECRQVESRLVAAFDSATSIVSKSTPS